ncbi:hypothetical protein NE237_005530 [Protea cynaroides]|uniref:Uncharacterized protein n=1 Tax=Protea cynaroides TaxID=273540 RepID=A0A9Q0KKZ4_9MAGN|nr:hypothetical protein NE237_005530 [Protea cynaroides]
MRVLALEKNDEGDKWTEVKQEGATMAKTGSSTSSDASKVSTCEPKIEGEGKAFCRCEEGWTCVITKTKGPDAGKMFFKCGEGCTCVSVTDAGITTSISSPEGFGGLGGGKVFCKCEDGWACEIYRTEAPDAVVFLFYIFHVSTLPLPSQSILET